MGRVIRQCLPSEGHGDVVGALIIHARPISVVGLRMLEPEMSSAEQQGLQRSAEAIKAALSRLSLKEFQRRTA